MQKGGLAGRPRDGPGVDQVRGSTELTVGERQNRLRYRFRNPLEDASRCNSARPDVLLPRVSARRARDLPCQSNSPAELPMQ